MAQVLPEVLGCRCEVTTRTERHSAQWEGDTMAVQQRYPGIYAAMATPLTAERQIDRDGVKRVVDHLLGAGIDGLSVLGSTGECNGLQRSQRQELLHTVVEAAA